MIGPSLLFDIKPGETAAKPALWTGFSDKTATPEVVECQNDLLSDHFQLPDIHLILTSFYFHLSGSSTVNSLKSAFYLNSALSA